MLQRELTVPEERRSCTSAAVAVSGSKGRDIFPRDSKGVWFGDGEYCTPTRHNIEVQRTRITLVCIASRRGEMQAVFNEVIIAGDTLPWSLEGR